MTAGAAVVDSTHAALLPPDHHPGTEKFELEEHQHQHQQPHDAWLWSLVQSAANHAPSFTRDAGHSSSSISAHDVLRLTLSLGRRFLYAFVPQIARTRYFDDPVPAAKVHATSWMNGLRGVASLFVFNEHYVYNYTYTLIVGIGTHPNDRYVHQLPVLELFNDGVCGVVVFFTIAGYVCSFKPLQAMTAGDYTGLAKSLPASVFRRWFRLYLPVLCSTLAISLLARAGAYNPTRHLFRDQTRAVIFPGPGSEPQPLQFPTLGAQLADWLAHVTKLCNFWVDHPADPPLDFHLWTIVYEYRASMHLYIALVALAACKTWARIAFLGLLGYIYAFRFAHYELVCFFWGAILAQLDVLRQHPDQLVTTTTTTTSSSSPPSSPFSSSSSRRNRLLSHRHIPTLRALGYLLALYLMSFPMRGGKYPAPLYAHTVNPWLPAAYGRSVGPKFPKQLGVLLLLSLLTTTPPALRPRSRWHRLLTCGPAAYLGRVMFGFYLVHGAVLHVFGYALPYLVWGGGSTEGAGRDPGMVVGDMGMARYLWGVGVGWAVSLLVSLWAADVWTREVEGRCVRVTKALERVVFKK